MVQTWILTLVFGVVGGMILGLAWWIGKRMNKIYYFESTNVIKPMWCWFRIKDGVFKQGNKRFLLHKAPQLTEKHQLFGNVPVYFFQKNHPTPFHPMDNGYTKKAKITPSELKDIMEMSVLTQLLAGIKQDFKTVLMFMAVGALVGGLACWAMITSGAVSIPAGLCAAAV